MFSQITGEFDQIEFAEYAAKRIRETVSGSKKISSRYEPGRQRSRS